MLENYLKEKSIDFVEVRVAIDKETKLPKNFGYVEFKTESEAQAAVEKLKGVKLGRSDGIKAVMNVE